MCRCIVAEPNLLWVFVGSDSLLHHGNQFGGMSVPVEAAHWARWDVSGSFSFSREFSSSAVHVRTDTEMEYSVTARRERVNRGEKQGERKRARERKGGKRREEKRKRLRVFKDV